MRIVGNYGDFQAYPFIETSANKEFLLRARIDILNYKKGVNPRTYLTLRGKRGVGKSTTLYKFRQMLDEEHIPYIFMTNLPQSWEEFASYNPNLPSMLERGAYFILIDHPDEVLKNQEQKSLNLLWQFISQGGIYANLQIYIAINYLPYFETFKLSQVLGKFDLYIHDDLDLKGLIDLIASRLGTIGFTIEQVFEQKAVEAIYTYTKGNARNSLAVCQRLFSETEPNKIISYEQTTNMLSKYYQDLILSDRIDELELFPKYKDAITILTQITTNGEQISKEVFYELLMKEFDIGRNTSIKMTNNLIGMGFFKEQTGGMRRTNRFLSVRNFNDFSGG